MIIGIHQPNFVPWLGYFYKISRSDAFVLLDDVQYTKNSFINRNRIKSATGEQWITMPVLHTGKFGQRINETRIILLEKNYIKFLRALKMNYSKALYYNDIISMFEECDWKCDNLACFNENLIRQIARYLEIETPIIRSSSIPDINTMSSERLVQICNHLGADKYLAGFGSKNYQDDFLFESNGIEPIVYDFVHPQYRQLYDSFIPNLSIIDLMMNIGKDTIKYL